MNSLTPFIRHELALPDPDFPGPEFPAPAPPDEPQAPMAQVPPKAEPGTGVPMTDGTPAACRQKNADEFLAGHSPGVMAQYGGQLFGTEQNTHSAHPAPEEPDPAESGVLSLVDWRENAHYG